MKKILAIIMLLVMAVACVSCAQTRTAKTPEETMFTYTLSNETGKTIDKAFVADDNSANKAEVAFTEGGLANGEKATVSVTAVTDKEGNPNLTVSYTIAGSEYMAKVHQKEGIIALVGEEVKTEAEVKEAAAEEEAAEAAAPTEGTMFTYTLSNETGETIDKAFVADDNSASKAEVAFTEGGLANGEKVTVSVTAVADKEGNPSLTVSYTIAGTEYMAKVHQKDGVIALAGEVEPAQEPAEEGKMFTFTLSNESGKTIDKAFVADDNSASKAEVAFTEGGLANGEKVTVSLTAVVDKDGNPNLTASYTIGGTEYMTKVNAQEGTIVLNGEGETAAPQK